MCMSKKVLVDCYNSYFKNSSEIYCRIVSKLNAERTEEIYRFCKCSCYFYCYELEGIVRFLKMLGVFTEKEEKEEREKINTEFCVDELIELYFGKVEV